MAVIRITNFGGLVPKASPRVIPDNGAQTASDLLPSITEFRPYGQDTTVVNASGVTNPLTIYRMSRTAAGAYNTDMTTGWIVRAADISFAKVPLNDDVSERTIATYNDGLTAPRVFDVNDLVTGRQLGVPAPTTAPTITVNVTEEFTDEERSGGIDNILLYLKNSTAALISPVWLGAPRPGTGTPGYADRDTIPGTDAQEAEQLRLFRTSSTGSTNNGALTDPYTGVASSFSWIFDGGMDGFWKTAAGSGWPAWAGTTYDHWCIPLSAYGLCYELNGAGLTAALGDIDMPGSPGDPLLTNDQVTDIGLLVADMFNQKYTNAQPKINALSAKVTQTKVLLDGGTAGASVAANTAYYASATIANIITAAIAEAAEAYWNKAVEANAA